MSFEFDIKTAKAIRNDDLELRALAALQQDGVCRLSQSAYKNMEHLRDLEGDYWCVFVNAREREVLLVSNDNFPRVYEG